MSNSSFVESDIATGRGRRSGVRGVPAGMKRFSKRAKSKAERRAAQAQVFAQMTELEVQALSPAEMEDYADWLMDPNGYTTGVEEFDYLGAIDADEDKNFLSLSESEHRQVPVTLEASLPDWMLNRLASANGCAFESLSMFEAKSATTRAVFFAD